MAAPQVQFQQVPIQQVPGGYDVLDEDKMQENFLNEINFWDFYGDSSTVFMNSISGKRQVTHAIIRKHLGGTYFEFLPMELIEMIFELERQLEISQDYKFYTELYFSDDDAVIETARHLRPTRTQRELIATSGEVTGLDVVQTPLGHTFGRRVWKNNTAARIAREFRRMVYSFNEDKPKAIKQLFHLITKHMMWIVHHSYLCEWNRFMRVIYQKQSEFEHRLAMYEVSDEYKEEIPKNMKTPEQRAPVWENLIKIRFFLEQYVPYALLSQGDCFHNAANDVVQTQDHIKTTLFEIYMITGVHPNSIDIQKAREFEMKLYAPKYYQETYENYMKLRSGRRLIPKGELPEFYWCAGKYIQRFL